MSLRYCINCGMELPKNVQFCPRCGSSVKAMEKKIEMQRQGIVQERQAEEPTRQTPVQHENTHVPFTEREHTTPTSTAPIASPFVSQQSHYPSVSTLVKQEKRVRLSPFFTKAELLGISLYSTALWGGHAFRYIFFQDAFPSLSYLGVNYVLTLLFTFILFMVYVNTIRDLGITDRMRFYMNDQVTAMAITTFALGYFPDILNVQKRHDIDDKMKAKIFIMLSYVTVSLSVFLSFYLFFGSTSIKAGIFGDAVYVTLKDLVLTASGMTLLFFIPSPISLSSRVTKHFGIRQTIFISACVLFIANALSSLTLSYLSQLV